MAASEGSYGIPLVGLAHGSRHPAGAIAIEDLLAEVARLGAIETHPAYLDLAAPDLAAAANALATAGHSRAVVVPLLFTAAYHATIDTPEAVRRAAATSGIELELTDILGTGDDIVDLLRASLADAGVGPEASVLVVAVGSSNPAANQAVADLAERLAADRATPGGSGGVNPGSDTAPGRAAFATCDPRPEAVVAELAAPVAIVPLFLADGLLLSPVRALAAEHGWVMTEPLGRRAAGVVLDRYRSALDRF
jgi:sirohydrochlorin ferrochelatase